MRFLRRREFITTSAFSLAAAGRRQWAAEAPSSQRRRRIKVGQIGTAHAHASGKLQTVRKLADEFEVVGVVEPDAGLRRKAAENNAYRDIRWLSEEELLATRGLDAVLVETEVKQLLSTAKRCIDAGLSIHLDKPAGESLADFRRLLRVAQRKSLCVQMGYMYRHNPAFRFCFQAADQGWLGKIFAVHGVMAKQSSVVERNRNLPYRGGMMFELGCHLIDALVRVLGKADSVAPFARNIRRDLDRLPDNQLAVFEYPSALATIRVSVTEVDGARRRQFVVCGTNGTIEIRPLEPPELTLTLNSPKGGYAAGRHRIPLRPMTGRYDDQLRMFAAVVRGETKREYSAGHDLAVQEMILRASGVPLQE